MYFYCHQFNVPYIFFLFLLKCEAAAGIIFYSELISDSPSEAEGGANAHTTLIPYRSLEKKKTEEEKFARDHGWREATEGLQKVTTYAAAVSHLA